MNPLTLVKRIQKINSTEATLGISEDASWHANYKDSAYVFVGGVPFDLTEGDLLAVFAQYGEIVDVNLVRDKAIGKSKGFAFAAYEDQRSTILAVDNLNGAKILGRIIRVDHVSNYKRKQEEDESEGGRDRPAEYAMLFKGASVIVDLIVNFLMMSFDVLIPVGVRRIGRDGAILSILVLQKVTRTEQTINSRWMNTSLDLEPKTVDIDARYPRIYYDHSDA